MDAPADPIMSVEEVQRQEEVAVVEPILVVDQPPSITSIISPQSPEKLAKSECARIGAIHEDITKAEVDSLRQLQPLAVTDAGVGEELCKAVTGVCRNNAKNRMICGTPIINQLKDVVKAHMNKPGVVEAGVYALGWIAHANSDNMASIISSDALATVYAVMEAHPASAAIQRAACQTLRTYANDSAAVVVLGSDGRAVPLLNAAKENMSGDMFVPSRAYDVLKKITGISP